MGWLWLLGSLKLQVSFAKEPCRRDYILQKRHIISRSLLIVATPYHDDSCIFWVNGSCHICLHHDILERHGTMPVDECHTKHRCWLYQEMKSLFTIYKYHNKRIVLFCICVPICVCVCLCVSACTCARASLIASCLLLPHAVVPIFYCALCLFVRALVLGMCVSLGAHNA